MRLPNLGIIARPVAAAFLSCGVAIVSRMAWKYLCYLRSPLHKLPGPKGAFWLGNFVEVFKEPFFEPHKRWWKEAGYDIPLLRYWGPLGSCTVIILDRDIVKDIITAPQGTSELRFGRLVSFIRGLVGDGLVTVQGPDWKRHRQIVQPAFHNNLVKTLVSESVPLKVKSLIDCWNKTAGRELDVDSHLAALTLDVIGDVAFGHDFHGLDTLATWANKTSNDDNKKNQDCNNADDVDEKLPQVNDPFVKALKDSFLLNPLTYFFFAFRVPHLDIWFNPQSRRTRRLLNAATDQMIQNARNNGATTSPSGGATSAKSLINVLMDAKGQDDDGKDNVPTSQRSKTLTDIELRDETKTFVLAGHETTSTWCYWAIFALVKHPEAQDRVYQEIMRYAPPPPPPPPPHPTSTTAAAGQDNGSSSIVDVDKIYDLDTLEQMEYFNAFLQEVLRLYSPVGVMPRMTKYEETFAGYTIPAGTRILIPIHLLHRHPKYWKDPEVFQPERWIDKSDREDMMAKVRFAFLPFSAGQRNCIGHRFASTEAKLIMAPLIRSFLFQIAPSRKDTEFTFTSFITMKTKPSFRVCVQARG